MTQHRAAWRMRSVVAALAVCVAACGGSDGGSQSTATPTLTATRTPTRTNTIAPLSTVTATPTRTATPAGTQGVAAVTGLLVVNRSVQSGNGDVLNAPPEAWTKQPDAAAFDRALSNADWSLAGTPDNVGVTGADGSFFIPGLPPGRYALNVSKTLDGNLAAVTVPFTVGPDGGATVVAEVAWGLVKSTSTFTDGGHQIQEIRGPYGTWVVTSDGRIVEIGDPTRTLTDANGDGQFDAPACVDSVWDCSADRNCGADRVCACTASCPACDDCGPGVCAPAGASVYRCGNDGTCAQPTDRCVCVSSCPDCKDCTRQVCVPACVPVDIAAINIIGAPAELVVGQQATARAIAQLSDNSQIDVSQLVTWRSSNDAAVTIDSWGNISAQTVGSAQLTATIGTLVSAPWTVDVVERPTLQRIDIQNVSCYYPLGVPTNFGSAPPVAAPPSSGILPPMPSCGQVVQIGRTIQFRAVGEFANGYYQDITDEVQWQVTPAGVGTVVGGVFTAQQAGTTTLTAALDGVVSDGTDIRVVTEPTVTALSIYADNGIIAFVGDTPQRVDVAIPCPIASAGAPCCCPGPLADGTVSPCNCGYAITVLRGDQVKFRATAQYDTGDFRDVTEQVTWRTSNAAAATIDAQGVMTAVEAGDATIDAVLGDVTSNPVDTHVVNEATLQSLYIYQDGTDRVVAKGDQRFFKATGNYDIGFGRDVTNVATWRSSDDNIGGFDTPGVFTARAAGTVQIWAELNGQQSDHLSLEVYETSDITYCDPAHVNRAVWSDNFNLVTLESDCGEYRQPGVAGLRYTVTELQPRGGIFDPCLDLYVYQGNKRVRTVREEGCGDPFLPAAAPGYDQAVLKYQLRAFWDLKGDDGQPVAPGTYTIYGRFYLYYDPVVSIDVQVLLPDGTLPTRTPTPTAGPVCTPPPCPTGGVLACPGTCPGGCGYVCVPPGQLASLEVGSATGTPGDSVQFDVTLHAGGQPVAGTQNDLLFDPKVPVAARDNGRPDCAVNADIDKNATGFNFIPAGCQPGIGCKGMRAIVIATDNTDVIPDGAVLYTCHLTIPSDVASGSYPLIAANSGASDPLGNPLPIASTNGAIVVLGTPGETPPQTVSPTPTPPPYPVCTPLQCPAGQVRTCPDKCLGGCGFVCATPTPTPFVVCTPPACKPDEVLFCPGNCPDGCGVVCGAPTLTPTPEGWCFHGADCQGGASPTTRALCCTYSRESESPLPFTWCPLDQFDAATGKCAACADDPCGAVPPTPQVLM
jgi:hypothetical protein